MSLLERATRQEKEQESLVAELKREVCVTTLCVSCCVYIHDTSYMVGYTRHTWSAMHDQTLVSLNPNELLLPQAEQRKFQEAAALSALEELRERQHLAAGTCVCVCVCVCLCVCVW